MLSAATVGSSFREPLWRIALGRCFGEQVWSMPLWGNRFAEMLCGTALGSSFGEPLWGAAWASFPEQLWSTLSLKNSSFRGQLYRQLRRAAFGNLPADLRVSSGNVIVALLASFWWPSRAEAPTRKEGRKTKENPIQSQERPTNELKYLIVTGYQPLAKYKLSKAISKTPTVRNPFDGKIKPPRGSTIGIMHRNYG